MDADKVKVGKTVKLRYDRGREGALLPKGTRVKIKALKGLKTGTVFIATVVGQGAEVLLSNLDVEE